MSHVFMARNLFERAIPDPPNAVTDRGSIVLKAILGRFALPAIHTGGSFAYPRTIEFATTETRGDSAVN
jgi:hypothetical protein